jgi:hypothetical protein
MSFGGSYEGILQNLERREGFLRFIPKGEIPFHTPEFIISAFLYF